MQATENESRQLSLEKLDEHDACSEEREYYRRFCRVAYRLTGNGARPLGFKIMGTDGGAISATTRAFGGLKGLNTGLIDRLLFLRLIRTGLRRGLGWAYGEGLIPYWSLQDANLRNANLRNANLRNAKFSDTDHNRGLVIGALNKDKVIWIK